jgi:arginine utilization protein RocB
MQKKEFSSKQKDLHVFKIKEKNSINGTKGKVIPDKIGFVLGEFPYISIIDEKNNEND